MSLINVVDDYHQIKLAQIRHINELIERLKRDNVLGSEKEIELNIEGCITDYPATPKFISYFLDHLSNQEGEKKLIIKYDGLGNKELYILYVLVLEGEFFGIKDKIESEEEVSLWKKTIDKKLKDNNILLQVVFTPDQKMYTYGD